STPKGGDAVLGDADTRYLVVQAERHRVAAERPHTHEGRDRPCASEALHEPVEHLDAEERLRHREVRPGVDLLPKALELELDVVGGRVDGHADEEGRRRVDALAKVVPAVAPRGAELEA